MTGIFAQLSAGQPGLDGLGATEKRPVAENHLVDVPVLDTPDPAPTGPCRRLRAACAELVSGSRADKRNRTRVLQLLLTIAALAFIRPQFDNLFQWAALLVLVHTFIFSFVLLWDKRLGGTIVRVLLPLFDWRDLELRYTSTVTLVLYVLFYGQLFAHKGYWNAWCNWVSTVLCLLSSLAYGLETWLQLRDAYDGRPAANN